MKLSEAIRLGSMLGPQSFRTLKDERGGLCAAGCAFEAIGMPLDALREAKADRPTVRAKLAELAPHWIPLMESRAECPVCGKTFDYLPMPHLNDTHKWTREQIADWVETIENALEAVISADVPAVNMDLTSVRPT